MIGQPMIWGRTDCHAFCLQCLDVMTGRDDFKVLRGAYYDIRGALRRWRELGDCRIWLKARGAREVEHPHFGDIVIYDKLNVETEWPGSVSALSMMGDRVMMPVGDSGYLGIVPIWAVGRVQCVMRIEPPCLKQ